MKKIILNTLLSTLLITGVVATPYLYKKYQENLNENQTEVNAESSDRIRIVNIKRSNTSDGYGQTEFTYSVSPNNTNAKIQYKLQYSDGSSVAEDILNITHYAGSSRFVVKCNKAFNKQIHLILYPLNQEDVTAVVKFDFKEKLSVSSSLVQNEGSYLDVNTLVTSTGGSVSVDKTIKNETYSWNDDFVQYIKNYLRSMDGQYSNEPDWYNDNNCSIMTGTNKFVGLEDADLQKWFTTNKFTTDSFVTSIYYEIEYWYEVDDDITIGSTTIPAGYETEHYYEKYYINDMNSLYFNDVFNGEYEIIDYSCQVNGETYTSSFGLSLSQISVTNISTSIGSYEF